MRESGYRLPLPELADALATMGSTLGLDIEDTLAQDRCFVLRERDSQAPTVELDTAALMAAGKDAIKELIDRAWPAAESPLTWARNKLASRVHRVAPDTGHARRRPLHSARPPGDYDPLRFRLALPALAAEVREAAGPNGGLLTGPGWGVGPLLTRLKERRYAEIAFAGPRAADLVRRTAASHLAARTRSFAGRAHCVRLPVLGRALGEALPPEAGFDPGRLGGLARMVSAESSSAVLHVFKKAIPTPGGGGGGGGGVLNAMQQHLQLGGAEAGTVGTYVTLNVGKLLTAAGGSAVRQAVVALFLGDTPEPAALRAAALALISALHSQPGGLLPLSRLEEVVRNYAAARTAPPLEQLLAAEAEVFEMQEHWPGGPKGVRLKAAAALAKLSVEGVRVVVVGTACTPDHLEMLQHCYAASQDASVPKLVYRSAEVVPPLALLEVAALPLLWTALSTRLAALPGRLSQAAGEDEEAGVRHRM
eukprot:XP_001698850.1 predicted protein [Chlamydomonas reinhardtii]